MDDAVVFLPIDRWKPEVTSELLDSAISALEAGKVLLLPQLSFPLSNEEAKYLRSDCVKGDIKSIKYSHKTETVWGYSKKTTDTAVLKGMLRRYGYSAKGLLDVLLPEYSQALKMDNTSYRPVEVEGRSQSKRHDDSRLHVDAFPSRPNGGERLLRVFTNIHPEKKPRTWRLGEPFTTVADRFLMTIPEPVPVLPIFLKMLGITKSLRTPYDHYMLHLHDRMKLDGHYQENASQTTQDFKPGSTWIVFTDVVSHAAMSGQYVMEQTFTLPVTAMRDPKAAPIAILEKIVGHPLGA